ncbi:MAG: DNA polymerase III subunit delta [Microthrixaceae bacterium]
MTIKLLKGSDPVLLEDAAVEAVRSAVGEADRAEVLEEFRGDDYELGEVCLAATTISMFGERVVVARNLARFSAKEVAPLVELLGDAPSDVTMVLVWDKPLGAGLRANPLPKKLSDAVKAAGGEVVDTTPPSGRGRSSWFTEQFESAEVELDASARALIEQTLGEDVGRLPALLELLAAAHPGGEPMGAREVAPLLGDAGGVPPWDLTDAIDRGDTAGAVDLVRRMVAAGGRHPLQVMVTLQTHFERMLRLDGSGIRSDKEAAAALGMKGSTFPAKKALERSRQLGHDRLARATQMLAKADLELRGATANPPELVIELLVARLAALGRRGR